MSDPIRPPTEPQFTVETGSVDPFQALNQSKRDLRIQRSENQIRGGQTLIGAQFGRESEAFTALNQAAQGEGLSDSDIDSLGLISLIALTTGVGIATGNLPLVARTVAQSGTVFGFEALERMTGQNPQSAQEAIPGALIEGGFAGTAEALSGPVARGIGGLARLTNQARRRVVNEVRGVLRRPPRLNVPKMGPTRAPFRPFIRDVEEAEAAVQTADELGLVVPPAYLVENNIVDIAQNIANAAIVGGQRTRSLTQAFGQFGSQAIRSTVGRLPRMTSRQTMSLVQRLVNREIDEVKGVARGLYRQADEMLFPEFETITRQVSEEAGTPFVDAFGRPLTRTVTREISEEVLTRNGVDLRPLKSEVRKVLQKQEKGILGTDSRLRRILKKKDFVPFEDAQLIRSDLFDISRQFDLVAGATAPRNRAAATRLSSALTRSINETASRAGPEVRQVLDQANSIWRREVKGELTDELVKRIANESPDDLIDILLTSNSKVSDIRFMRKLTNRADPSGRAWEAVQGSFLRRMLFEASDPVVTRAGTFSPIRPISGDKLLKLVDDFSGADQAAVRAMFGGSPGQEVLNNVRLYANAMRAIERGTGGSRAGSIFFNLLQASAVGGIVFSLTQDPSEALSVGGASVILGPAAVNRLMSTPRIAKWLSVGAMSTPGSRSAARATLVTLGDLIQNRLLDSEQMEKVRSLVRSAQEQLGIEPGSGLNLRVGPSGAERLREIERRQQSNLGRRDLETE